MLHQFGMAYLSYFLVNHLERIQRRSLRIISLPVDALPREIEEIIRVTNHPRHHLVPVAHKHNYSTRIKENSANVVEYLELKDINHRLCLGRLNFLTINFKFLL
jgi:effector-binding domain-containing protein